LSAYFWRGPSACHVFVTAPCFHVLAEEGTAPALTCTYLAGRV